MRFEKIPIFLFPIQARSQGTEKENIRIRSLFSYAKFSSAFFFLHNGK